MSTTYGSENEDAGLFPGESSPNNDAKPRRGLTVIGVVLMVVCVAGAYSSLNLSQPSLRTENMELTPLLEVTNSSSSVMIDVASDPSLNDSSAIFITIDKNNDGVVELDEILQFYQDQKNGSVKKIQDGAQAAGISVDTLYEKQSKCVIDAYTKVIEFQYWNVLMHVTILAL